MNFVYFTSSHSSVSLLVSIGLYMDDGLIDLIQISRRPKLIKQIERGGCWCKQCSVHVINM